MIAISVDDQRILAAYTFPDEWKAAQNLTGERRQRVFRRLRDRAITHWLLRDIQAIGGHCGNCDHYKDGCCTFFTDFGTRSVVTRNYVCTAWEAKTT